MTLLSSDKNTRRNGTVGSVRSNFISNLPKRLTLKDNKWEVAVVQVMIKTLENIKLKMRITAKSDPSVILKEIRLKEDCYKTDEQILRALIECKDQFTEYVQEYVPKNFMFPSSLYVFTLVQTFDEKGYVMGNIFERKIDFTDETLFETTETLSHSFKRTQTISINCNTISRLYPAYTSNSVFDYHVLEPLIHIESSHEEKGGDLFFYEFPGNDDDTFVHNYHPIENIDTDTFEIELKKLIVWSVV